MRGLPPHVPGVLTIRTRSGHGSLVARISEELPCVAVGSIKSVYQKRRLLRSRRPVPILANLGSPLPLRLYHCYNLIRIKCACGSSDLLGVRYTMPAVTATPLPVESDEQLLARFTAGSREGLDELFQGEYRLLAYP